jgi:hypothetical protein
MTIRAVVHENQKQAAEPVAEPVVAEPVGEGQQGGYRKSRKSRRKKGKSRKRKMKSRRYKR